MSKFANLKKFEINGKVTVDYEMTDIEMGGKTPIFQVLPATEINKAFARAQLKTSNKRVRTAASKGVSLEMLEANREDDRKLYADYVVQGWKNVIDQDGNEVLFTSKDCAEFLEALPGWIFDNMRAFCSQPVNFSETVDEEEVGN